MSNITVNVEFLAGTDLRVAIEEAKEKCVKWDVAYVCFDFNGVSFSIGKNADTLQCWEEFLHTNRKIIVSN